MNYQHPSIEPMSRRHIRVGSAMQIAPTLGDALQYELDSCDDLWSNMLWTNSLALKAYMGRLAH
jgi:hypothetical protein